MVAFLGGERADNGEAVGLFGELGEVLAELQARGLGRDFFELAAVGVAGLHVEGIGLAGAAGHPEKDAVAAAARIGGDLRGERGQPVRAAGAEQAKAHVLEHQAAIDRGVAIGHDWVL
jgi:hypothetical protein